MTTRSAHLCGIDCGGALTCGINISDNPNTIGYMQVIPPAGDNNYRVEYKLGDEVNTVWVDADGYGIDDNGVANFWVNSLTVFTATHVFSVTWVRSNKAESPAPLPAPWAPTPPFLPPYRIGDFPPYGGTITV